MRRFSARMFPNVVTLYPVSYGQDRAGGRTKSYPDVGTDLAASVQMMDAVRLAAFQGSTRSQIGGLVLFAGDPGVKVDDRLAWRVVPGDPTRDRSATVLGPATPEAGRDSLYSVPISEWK